MLSFCRWAPGLPLRWLLPTLLYSFLMEIGNILRMPVSRSSLKKTHPLCKKQRGPHLSHRHCETFPPCDQNISRNHWNKELLGTLGFRRFREAYLFLPSQPESRLKGNPKGGEPDRIPKDVPQWPAHANQISASTFRCLLMMPLCDGIRALRYFIQIYTTQRVSCRFNFINTCHTPSLLPYSCR